MSPEEPGMWITEVSDDVRTRIQLIYMEMPEIRLTRQQIRRLLSLPVDACEDAIRALVTSGFLAESLEGVLVRGGTLAPRH
jgi:transcription initiation factor IIE alpha subunit